MAAKKFLGCQYPLVTTPRGVLAQSSDVDQIKADLLQLLLTNPGERCMLPTFGTPLRTLVFEPNDPALAFKAKQMISNAILQWEPRVVVTDISVAAQAGREGLNRIDTGDETDAILSIKISFVDPQNISQVEELVLQVPLGD